MAQVETEIEGVKESFPFPFLPPMSDYISPDIRDRESNVQQLQVYLQKLFNKFHEQEVKVLGLVKSLSESKEPQDLLKRYMFPLLVPFPDLDAWFLEAVVARDPKTSISFLNSQKNKQEEILLDEQDGKRTISYPILSLNLRRPRLTIKFRGVHPDWAKYLTLMKSEARESLITTISKSSKSSRVEENIFRITLKTTSLEGVREIQLCIKDQGCILALGVLGVASDLRSVLKFTPLDPLSDIIWRFQEPGLDAIPGFVYSPSNGIGWFALRDQIYWQYVTGGRKDGGIEIKKPIGDCKWKSAQANYWPKMDLEYQGFYWVDTASYRICYKSLEGKETVSFYVPSDTVRILPLPSRRLLLVSCAYEEERRADVYTEKGNKLLALKVKCPNLHDRSIKVAENTLFVFERRTNRLTIRQYELTEENNKMYSWCIPDLRTRFNCRRTLSKLSWEVSKTSIVFWNGKRTIYLCDYLGKNWRRWRLPRTVFCSPEYRCSFLGLDTEGSIAFFCVVEVEKEIISSAQFVGFSLLNKEHQDISLGQTRDKREGGRNVPL